MLVVIAGAEGTAGTLMPNRVELTVEVPDATVECRSAATALNTFIAEVCSTASLLEANPTGKSAKIVIRQNVAIARARVTSTRENADGEVEGDLMDGE